MTVVIGVLGKDDKVYVGSDTYVYTGNIINLVKEDKVIKFDNVVIGSCGNHALIGVLKAYEDSFPKFTGKNYHKYLVTKLIPYIQESLESTSSDFENTLLVGINDRLFVIHSDYAITEPRENFWAIGAGQEVALGVLELFYNELEPDVLIKNTVTICSKYIISCNDEVVVKNTK